MEDNVELLAEVLTMPLKSLNRERVCLINNIDIDVSCKIIIHNNIIVIVRNHGQNVVKRIVGGDESEQCKMLS